MHIAKGTLYLVVLPFVCCGISLISSFLFEIPILGICSIIFLLFGIFALIFFRDPERSIGDDIVAPADGTIRDIYDSERFKVVSTFMNIHNVHVNRTPIEGTVLKVIHLNGKHYPAYNAQSMNNEKVITIMNTEIGIIKIVQIAGIFARRVVSYLKNGDRLEKGQRIGIIKFGSRVDLYLPAEKVEIIVQKNQKVYAGMTTIATIKKIKSV
jgi:phosphatidylserine decarboxylase